MSSALNHKTIVCAACLLVVGLLTSCGVGNDMPPTWVKDIPGIYEGVFGQYREVLVFSTNGDYRHEFFRGKEQITLEYGKWSAVSNIYEISIIPKTSFTQHYDPMRKTFSEKGSTFSGYDYSPLSEGETFSKISASVNYEFTLVRKK